jgi:hypothetical protein
MKQSASPFSANDLLNPDSLNFRAACNEPLPPAQRPLKKRVLQRISKSEDAKEICARILADFGELCDQRQATQFWATLATDLAWKTLVIEQVDLERNWKDLLNPDLEGKIWDLIQSAVEKIWDSYHPVTRIAGLSAISLLSLIVTERAVNSLGNSLNFQPLKDLGSIPLSAPKQMPQLGFSKDDLDRLRLQIPADAPPFKLQDASVSLADPSALIGNFHDSSTSLIRSEVDLRHALETSQQQNQNLPNNLDLIARQLQGISAKLKSDSIAAKDPKDLYAELDQMSGNLQGVATQLDTQESKLQSQIDKSNEELRSAVDAGAFSAHLTLSGKGIQAIVLPVVDPAKKAVEPVPLVIQVKEASGAGATGRVTLTVTAQGKSHTWTDLAEGQINPIENLGGVAGTLVVNSIDHRLGFLHTVHVTITPNL